MSTSLEIFKGSSKDFTLPAMSPDGEASGLWKDILLEMRVGDWFEVRPQKAVAIYRAAWRLRMKITTQKGATTLRVTRVA